MAYGDAERIRSYLCQQVEEARQAGEAKVTFRVGDIHKALRLEYAYANVSQVLDGALFCAEAGVEFSRYMYRPPLGKGSNLEIEFRILPSQLAE